MIGIEISRKIMSGSFLNRGYLSSSLSASPANRNDSDLISGK
jgi:hypothetical protein